jgi:uncharacterized protein (DUF1697 family)
MLEYISLVRGINVGGKTLKMDVLKSLYASLGFTDITTYIQSGNVLFNPSAKGKAPAADAVEAIIKKKTGLDVTVINRTRHDFIRITAQNPFIKAGNRLIDKMHVTFLDRQPDTDLVKKLSLIDRKGDEFKVVGSEIYLLCPNGYGQTVLTNNFFEKRLKCGATTRNWGTVNKLLELASVA